MSQPPEQPGRGRGPLGKPLGRVERMATRSGGGAYEGAFEAVGAILIATLLGYWFDHHYETEPVGVIVGAGIGFAAFVLRLVRLGKQLHPDAGVEAAGTGGAGASPGVGPTDATPPGTIWNADGDAELDDAAGPGAGLGLSPLLDDDERRDEDERR